MEIKEIKCSELEIQFSVQGFETVKKCTTLSEATNIIEALKIYHPEIITMKLRFYKIEDSPGMKPEISR